MLDPPLSFIDIGGNFSAHVSQTWEFRRRVPQAHFTNFIGSSKIAGYCHEWGNIVESAKVWLCWQSSFRWISVRMRHPQWGWGSLNKAEAVSVKLREMQFVYWWSSGSFRLFLWHESAGLYPKLFLIFSGWFLKHAGHACYYSHLRRVCKVTFKHLHQTIRIHIQSFWTLGQLFKIHPFSPKNCLVQGEGGPQFIIGLES